MYNLINTYLKEAETYTLYIQPFELSDREMPKISEAGFLNHIRSHRGLHKVVPRIEVLIEELKKHDFQCMTFGQAWEKVKGESL